VIDLTYAKIIADSIGVDAPRLVTFELQYPRIIHAEFMTHRVFSRNASSSRAVPVMRVIENVLANPAMPAEWRMNEPGMQGFTTADEHTVEAAQRIMAMAAQVSRQLRQAVGLHGSAQAARQPADRAVPIHQGRGHVLAVEELLRPSRSRGCRSHDSEARPLDARGIRRLDAEAPVRHREPSSVYHGRGLRPGGDFPHARPAAN
jgi:hypothetical protein